jgi:predicted enzyme related to lactoylglutathione lyase
MLERDGYPPGVPCWIDTSQPDPEAAVGFYSGLFGWEFEDVMPPGSAGKYFIARLRGGDVAAVASGPEGGPPTAVWNTYIWVESADEAVAKVLDAGGRVLTEPFDVMDAGRMAVFADPEGAAFCVWQAKQHKGARIVNEHGSLNFNSLNTRDAAGAKSFYAALFGWESLDLGGAAMWKLPGYGDYLEQSNPGLRKQMADSGAPEGFEDVVAALNPIADDQPDAPAHWSVTFAVDDADATAARAAELGAQVIVPPFDAPWVRMTVITDPQGATFTASKYVPENKDLATHPASTAGAS